MLRVWKQSGLFGAGSKKLLRLIGSSLALAWLLGMLTARSGSIVEPPTPTPEVFNPRNARVL